MNHMKPLRASDPFRKLHQVLWGRWEDLKDNIFKVYDYEDETRIDSKGAESRNTFMVMELDDDCLGGGLGSMAFGISKMLVRNEYELAESAIESRRKEGWGGMMIRGQQGIGKSFCLVYLLVVRLLQKKATFFQTTSELIFFWEEGVFYIDPDAPVRLLKPDFRAYGITINNEHGPLLLMDSKGHADKPPPVFCDRAMAVFIVQAALPFKIRRGWLGRSNAVGYLMNPWTWPEIVAGNTLQNVPVKPISFLREVFETLGPFAGECYDTHSPYILNSKLDEIECACKLYELKTVSNIIINLETKDTSGEIVVMRSEHEWRILVAYELGSIVIARMCCKAWQLKLDEESRSVFARFGGPTRRILAGTLFGDIVREVFLAGDNGTRLPSQLRRLKSGKEIAGRYNFELSTIMADSEARIPRKLEVRFVSPGVDAIVTEQGKYYQPTYHNHPTSEAFLVDESGRLTLIQSTIAEEHAIESEHLNALQERLQGIEPATKERPWRIVLVIPAGQEGNFRTWVDQMQWAERLEVFVLSLALGNSQTELIRDALKPEFPSLDLY